MTESSAEFDALLLLSFGGPEGPADVRPFLENVTAGRGIPPERLDEVSEHYLRFGGISPLNKLNREIISHLQAELDARGRELPVYFGNRNWHPFGFEAAEQLARDGHRNVAVFATSAWGGYSGCKQYDEDIVNLRQHLKQHGLPEIRFTKLRQFYDHPLFIKAFVDACQEAIAELSPAEQEHFRLVFTAHSIPVAADNASGLPEDGPLYSTQVREAASLIAGELGLTDEASYDVVWQSRSGSPRIPWLEPDILDHAEHVHERGYNNLVVCPVGFVSDHIEVVWDLDSELQDEARRRGQKIVRARTPGPTPEFTAMVLELIDEQSPRRLGTAPSRGCSVNGEPCAPGCCPTRSRKPAPEV